MRERERVCVSVSACDELVAFPHVVALGTPSLVVSLDFSRAGALILEVVVFEVLL